MDEKERAANATHYKTDGKVTKSSIIRTTVRALFISHRKLTAKAINQITNSNDARKVISDLRRDGWNIVDIIQADHSKLYWLDANIRKGELFPKEGGDHE